MRNPWGKELAHDHIHTVHCCPSASSFFVDSQTALCPQEFFSPEWWKLQKMMHRIHYWQDDIVRRMWGTVRSLRIKIFSHSLVLITTCWFYIKMSEALSFVRMGKRSCPTLRDSRYCLVIKFVESPLLLQVFRKSQLRLLLSSNCLRLRRHR